MNVYSLFRVLKAFKLENFHLLSVQARMQVFFDGSASDFPHPDFASFYTSFFKPSKIIERGTTCARSALLVQETPEIFQASVVRDSVTVWDGGCYQHPWVLEFSQRFRSIYGNGVQTQPIGIQRPLVTVIVRSGHRRQLQNFQELQAALRDLPCVLEYVKLEQMNVGQQLHQIEKTDVLIGVHGAGLTLSLWLPPHAVVIEMMTLRHYEPTIGMMAYVHGHTYRIIAMGDTMKHSPDARVDVSEVRLELQAALSGLPASTETVHDQNSTSWRPQVKSPQSLLEVQGLAGSGINHLLLSTGTKWLQRDPISWAKAEGRQKERSAVLLELEDKFAALARQQEL